MRTFCRGVIETLGFQGLLKDYWAFSTGDINADFDSTAAIVETGNRLWVSGTVFSYARANLGQDALLAKLRHMT